VSSSCHAGLLPVSSLGPHHSPPLCLLAPPSNRDLSTDLDLQQEDIHSLLEAFGKRHGHDAGLVPRHGDSGGPQGEALGAHWSGPHVVSTASICLSQGGAPVVGGVTQLAQVLHKEETCPADSWDAQRSHGAPSHRSVMEDFDLSAAKVALPLPDDPSYAEASDAVCAGDIAAKRVECPAAAATVSGAWLPLQHVKGRLAQHMDKGRGGPHRVSRAPHRPHSKAAPLSRVGWLPPDLPCMLHSAAHCSAAHMQHSTCADSSQHSTVQYFVRLLRHTTLHYTVRRSSFHALVFTGRWSVTRRIWQWTTVSHSPIRGVMTHVRRLQASPEPQRRW